MKDLGNIFCPSRTSRLLLYVRIDYFIFRCHVIKINIFCPTYLPFFIDSLLLLVIKDAKLPIVKLSTFKCQSYCCHDCSIKFEFWKASYNSYLFKYQIPIVFWKPTNVNYTVVLKNVQIALRVKKCDIAFLDKSI